ncbi:DUF2326 domain-containing protein [Romboutsia ilealis]|uniref:DUF2326 domain-containing protein n=1 Tax=Romboutsia faecis TaxID=2764597 RepID=A0ABR7JPI6_9FIRM|nr:DUF2326 domain-containing protein [Romboutsia faecis]MBC5996516.1 DUF2326 domain-containing protein [Romboutsia faecis]MRN24042.1 DUF2326 domain-containing protein [Romboutsia ilealis]
MILDTLYVYSLSNNKKIKEYSFNKSGLSVILGVKEEVTESNGAGKTTFIECIRTILGTSMPSNFTNSIELREKDIFIILKAQINEKNIFLGRRIINPENGYILESDNLSIDINLWREEEEENYKLVVQECNYIDIERTNLFPTFSQIREYIIRDEKEGFNSIFMSNRKPIDTHRAISFLSMLPENLEKEVLPLKEKNRELNKKKLLINNMSGDINELKLLKKKITEEVDKLKNIVNNVDINSKIEIDMDKYRNAKNELNIIERNIYKLEKVKKQYKKNTDNLKLKLEEIKKLEEVDKFYESILGYFPDKVKRNYEEVSEFYNFMVDNRGEYFDNKAKEIDKEIKNLIISKKHYQDIVDSSSKLLQQGNIVEDINSILEELNDKNLSLAEVNLKISYYNQKSEINKVINGIKKEIIELAEKQSELLESYKVNIARLSNTFDKLVEVTYGEKGLLEYELEQNVSLNKPTGRIKVDCTIDSEGSHGRNYMKINIFDLTLLINRINNNYILNYLIHDGSYCKPDDKYAKGRLIRYVDELLLDKGRGQYIITANTDEFNESDIEWILDNNKVIANLNREKNNENRFFGFKY